MPVRRGDLPGPARLESGVSIDIVRSLAERVPILASASGTSASAPPTACRIAAHNAGPREGVLIHHDGRGLFEGLPSPFRPRGTTSLVVLEDSVPPVDATDGGWEIVAWTDERPTAPNAVPAWSWASDASGPKRGRPPRRCSRAQFHPRALTPLGPALLANFLRACGGASKGR